MPLSIHILFPDDMLTHHFCHCLPHLQRKNDVLDNGFVLDPTGPAIATGGVTEGALYEATSPVKAIPMNGGDCEYQNEL